MRSQGGGAARGSARSDNALDGAGADAEFAGNLQDAVGAEPLDTLLYARPTANRSGTLVSSRFPGPVLSAIEQWALDRETTRSDAIRRLVELG
jgi:hypothetical protein